MDCGGAATRQRTGEKKSRGMEQLSTCFLRDHRLATGIAPPVGRPERVGTGVTLKLSFARYEGHYFL
jgi:hypothetical protein